MTSFTSNDTICNCRSIVYDKSVSGVVEQSSEIVEVSGGLSLSSKLVTRLYDNSYIPQVDSSCDSARQAVLGGCHGYLS